MIRFLLTLFVLCLFSCDLTAGPIRRVIKRIHDRRHPTTPTVSSFQLSAPVASYSSGTASAGASCGCSASGVCDCGPSCGCSGGGSAGVRAVPLGSGYRAAPPSSPFVMRRGGSFSSGGGSCAGGSCRIR